jgi:uncharacterized protein
VSCASVTEPAILWRRLDQPGHEAARLFSRQSRWHLAGAAVFTHDGQPCCLNYLVVCDSRWQTRSARIEGWVGPETIELEISVDSAQRWQLSGKERPEVMGCIDLDLNFSPSTNLLPIRRLNLPIGQEAAVRAAWLRFPSFSLEPLEQRYRRVDAAAYRYESAGGQFVTQLEVNASGFVTRYPGFWEADASAEPRS